MKKYKKLSLMLVLMCGLILSSCQKSDTEGNKGNTPNDEQQSSNENETGIDKVTEYANDDGTELSKKILESMLGSNLSADEIIYDLNFANTVDNRIIRYEVIDASVIDSKGRIKDLDAEDKEVIISASIGKNVRYFKFNVLGKENAAKKMLDVYADALIHNTDDIRDNITLMKKTGINGEISVSWELVNKEIFTKDRNISITIKKKPEQKEYNAYVYTYFRGNIYGDGESQHIHMAVSQDGFFWDTLNKNEPILKAELGTGGQDSFLIRSPYGDKFYLIGTDLDANGGDWAVYANKGSHAIRVWESADLVNWSEERLIDIAPKGAGCMWAPECHYDETTGEYVVYFSTGIVGGNGKKIYYVKTRDFYNFTEPQIFKDVEGKTTFIDTSITEYNGIYYRFTKNENEITILLEKSDPPGEYSLVKTRIANQWGVEGPGSYKINGQEKWCLYMDGYANENAGVGYFPLIAENEEDLMSGNFRRLEAGEFKMPEGAKHGSFVPITEEEYNALVNKWGK